MIKKESADYAVRGLELHSLYAWDYTWIMKVMDIMTKLEMNTLVLHRNDFVDAMVYPGKYFGYQAKDGDRSILMCMGRFSARFINIHRPAVPAYTKSVCF